MGWCLCAVGYPSRPEHNLDAVVLFVPEDFIVIWRLLQTQVMRDHEGGINLALLDAREQWM